jgi:hypothetical protein
VNRFYLILASTLFFTASLNATTYYVDSHHGDDSHAGISPSLAWRTLQKVNQGGFRPGDHILLRSGSRWQGQLSLTDSGANENPIVVDRYGDGALPRIDGEGAVESVLHIENAPQVEVRHLEITNHGATPALRRGVLIAAVNCGTLHHVRVSDLYIHDVNGSEKFKETGGIVFRTIGSRVPSNFDDLVIERNVIWKVDRSAIAGESDQVDRTKWHPSLHVMIRDNYAEDIGGDGIVPWATDGAHIEHNIVLRCNRRAGSFNAGIWPWSADNSVFEYNEAAFTHSTKDGEGFDSDYNSRNTVFRHNYSHDNDGGFMLICTPVKRDQNHNIGNTGTRVEYNISRNDHARIFNLSGADHSVIQHNAIYIAPADDVQILLVSQWDGWSTDALFRSNLFYALGTGHYGHEVARNEDGSYMIAPGWGGASNIRFERNRYLGNHIGAPSEVTSHAESAPTPAHLDWNEPIFDPAQPELFPAYLNAHRQWLRRLFIAQFGCAGASDNH